MLRVESKTDHCRPENVCMTQHLLPTTVVGSYPQPDWLVDRAMLATMVPRVRLQRAVARSPSLTSRRRRTTRRCWRSATWSAPASTSSPTARCAARATPTASPPRSRASTTTTPATITNRAGRSVKVPRVVGKIRRRARGRGRRHGVPAAQHRAQGKDHAARPVHHGAAGQERVLRRTPTRW